MILNRFGDNGNLHSCFYNVYWITTFEVKNKYNINVLIKYDAITISMNNFNANHELLNIALVSYSVGSTSYLVEVAHKKKNKLLKKVELLNRFFLTIFLTSWLSYSPHSSTTVFLGIFSGSFTRIIAKSSAKKDYYFTLTIISIFVSSYYLLFGISLQEKFIGISFIVITRILLFFDDKINLWNLINCLLSFVLSTNLLRMNFKYQEYLTKKISDIHQNIVPKT